MENKVVTPPDIRKDPEGFIDWLIGIPDEVVERTYKTLRTDKRFFPEKSDED